MHRGDDATNSGGDERLSAGGRLASVAARFQRDIGRCAAGLSAGKVQRFDFGMVAAESLVPSFADDAIGADEHAADHRIRLDKALTAHRQFERPAHVPQIEFILRHRIFQRSK